MAGHTTTMHTEKNRGASLYRQAMRLASGHPSSHQLRRAARLLKAATNMGNVEATNVLGYFYDYGIGLRTNAALAFTHYHRAALQGYPDAQYNLGACLLEGRGASKNLKFATHWLRSAVKAKVPEAFDVLGYKLRYGLGMKEESKARIQVAVGCCEARPIRGAVRRGFLPE